MQQNALHNAITLLSIAKRIGLFPVNADDLDSVCSAIALARVLERKGKMVTVRCGGQTPIDLNFLGELPGTQSGAPQTEPVYKVSISIPAGRQALRGLTYERQEDQFLVHIDSREPINPSQVRTEVHRSIPYDVIITLGASKLAELGQRFTADPELFYGIPMLNLDYHVENEQFGKVNVVRWESRSVVEIVYDLIMRWDRRALTTPVASSLLCGLLAQTESFQKHMTAPAQFELAATLLEAGADRATIIRHLYKTKPLPHLKLWGQVLSNLRQTAQGRIVWTTLHSRDFAASGTDPRALVELVRDLLAQTAPAQFITAIYQDPAKPKIVVLIAAPSNGRALQVAQALSKALNGSPSGNERLASCILPAQGIERVAQQVVRTCEMFLPAGYTGKVHATNQPRRNTQPAATPQKV